MGQEHKPRVLLTGDGQSTESATQLLEFIGCLAVTLAAEDKAADILRETAPDLVLLAVSSVHDPGIALCRAMRSVSGVPIIVLVGRGTEQACVDCLTAGADDFITKPSSSAVLGARIEAVIRRANADSYHATSEAFRCFPPSEGVLRVGNVRLDLTTCRVTVNGTVRTLTPNEFRLLAIFMRAPGDVFTREDLRRRVWPDDQHSLHLVEVHIANLRAKIEADPHHPAYIVTVRSRGYKFAALSG